MDFSFLDKYFPYFLSGTGITIMISVVTVILGTGIGLLMALLKLSKKKPLNVLANVYIEVLRGTPMLLQIMIGFLLLQGFFPSKDLEVGVLTVDLGRLLPGMIVLSLNSGAYVAEIIRGGDPGSEQRSNRSLLFIRVASSTNDALRDFTTSIKKYFASFRQ